MKLDFQLAGGLMQSLEVAAARYEDLGPPCRMWGGYKRKQVKEKIASGDGLPPLAESTLAKRRKTRTGRITTHGNLRAGAARRLDASSKRIGGLLKHYEEKYFGLGKYLIPKDVQRKVERLKKSRESINRAMAKVRADAGKIVVSREEFTAMRRANARAERGLAGWQGHAHDLSKYVVQRKNQFGKTALETKGDKRFPKLASTIRVSVIAKGTSGTVIVRCAAGIIGKVQNEGGPVGNGAEVPETDFLVLTSADIEVFKGMLIRHGVSVFEAES